MKRLIAIYILIGIGIILSIILPLLVKPSLVLSLELVGVCFHLGSAAIFLSSLGNFKTLLKVAYTFLASGYVLGGLGALQLPVIAMAGGIQSEWVESGLVGIPFVLSLILFYTGAVLAGRLFGIRNFPSRPYFAFPLAIGLGAIVGTLAPGDAFDASAHVFTMISTVFLCIAWLMVTIRNQASKRYSESLGWLAISFTLSAAALLQNLIVHLALPEGHWYADSVFITLGNLIPGFTTLLSSISLARLGVNADATFMEQDPSATSVDIITYMASLVSNQRDVDTTLDRLRVVTSQLKEGEPIPDVAQRQLAEVYIRLEDYLIHQERAQKFALPTLRKIIMRRFVNVKETNPVFWELTVNTTPAQG